MRPILWVFVLATLFLAGCATKVAEFKKQGRKDEYPQDRATLFLAGCATKVAEFKNPTSGEIGHCIPNREAAMMGALALMSEGDRYASCKTDFERRGFVRTPEGQESEETKQVIRAIDDARAASIRKQ